MIQRIRKFRKRGSQKTIFFSILFILLFFSLVGFLIISNWRINQRRSELISQISILEKEIKALEEKNKELKAGISEASSEAHLEEVARENLGLKRKGEEVAVILPPPEREEEGKAEEKGVWERILEKLKFW